MLIKQLNNNVYQILKERQLIGLYNCIEELLLWKGECPFDVEAGVDYFAIFNNREFVETALSKVLDKHKNAYKSYEISSLSYDEGYLDVSIIFNVSTDISYKFNLHIGDDI